MFVVKIQLLVHYTKFSKFTGVVLVLILVSATTKLSCKLLLSPLTWLSIADTITARQAAPVSIRRLNDSDELAMRVDAKIDWL